MGKQFVYPQEMKDYILAQKDMNVQQQAMYCAEHFLHTNDVYKVWKSIICYRHRNNISSVRKAVVTILTDDEKEYMKEHRYEYNNKKMTEKLNDVFGRNFSHKQVARFRRSHHLTYETFPAHIVDIIIANKEKLPREIANIIKEQTGIEYTYRQISSKLSCLGVKRKQYDAVLAANKKRILPIGTERLRHGEKGDYYEIKVAEGKWKQKQRVIYENYYGVTLKQNEVVAFADGDRTNFDVHNLIVVPRTILSLMNSKHRMGTGGAMHAYIAMSHAELALSKVFWKSKNSTCEK